MFWENVITKHESFKSKKFHQIFASFTTYARRQSVNAAGIFHITELHNAFVSINTKAIKTPL